MGEKIHLFNPFIIPSVTTKCGISEGVWILSKGTYTQWPVY
jgi:hypothetical protein